MRNLYVGAALLLAVRRYCETLEMTFLDALLHAYIVQHDYDSAHTGSEEGVENVGLQKECRSNRETL